MITGIVQLSSADRGHLEPQSQSPQELNTVFPWYHRTILGELLFESISYPCCGAAVGRQAWQTGLWTPNKEMYQKTDLKKGNKIVTNWCTTNKNWNKKSTQPLCRLTARWPALADFWLRVILPHPSFFFLCQTQSEAHGPPSAMAVRKKSCQIVQCL